MTTIYVGCIIRIVVFLIIITRGVDMANKVVKKRIDKHADKQRAEEIKKMIAEECGKPVSSIHNKTLFMQGQMMSYFDCVDAMYEIQVKYRKYGVVLPESSYVKYKKVDDLIKDINRQVRNLEK